MALTCMCSCVFTAPNNQTTLWSCGNQEDLELNWLYTMAGLRTSGSPMDPVKSSSCLFPHHLPNFLWMGLVFLVLCQICLLLTSIWKNMFFQTAKIYTFVSLGQPLMLVVLVSCNKSLLSKRWPCEQWKTVDEDIIPFIHRKVGVVYR